MPAIIPHRHHTLAVTRLVQPLLRAGELRELELFYNSFDEKKVTAPHTTHLQQRNIAHAVLDDFNMVNSSLATVPSATLPVHWPGVEQLDLSECAILSTTIFPQLASS